jgi:hypothetical protein
MKTKQEKRLDAVTRNITWNNLTKEQKLAELANRPGKCAKQIARILNK